MAAGNLPNMYQLLDRLATIVERQSQESEIVQQLAIQLGGRVLATQGGMNANIEQFGTVREDFARINASANNRRTQANETLERARELVDEVNTLLDGPPAQGNQSPGNDPPVPDPAPAAVPPLEWKIPCPFCSNAEMTLIIEMTLTIERVVTNNNVEYTCPFKLSKTTCQTGKKLGSSWKTHIKRTCLPKLRACPGLPISPELPSCPGQNNGAE